MPIVPSTPQHRALSNWETIGPNDTPPIQKTTPISRTHIRPDGKLSQPWKQKCVRKDRDKQTCEKHCSLAQDQSAPSADIKARRRKCTSTTKYRAIGSNTLQKQIT